MRKQTSLALALATMMVLGTVGFASSVSAQSVDGTVIPAIANAISGDKDKDHKDGDKHIYVALGTLGDVLVFCPGIFDIESITVNGNPVPVTQDTGVNSDGKVCIGGAAADMPEQTTNAWDIWATDLVWDTVIDNEVLVDDVFKVAGFARMDISYDYATLEKGESKGDDASTGEELCTPTEPGPVVCDQPGVGTWTATRAINTFGFCGQGVVNTAGGYLDPWDEMNNNDALPGELDNRENKAATKVVFIDSLATFLLDCSNAAGQLETVYNTAVGAVNQVTCSDQQNPDLLPLVPSLVCFFDLPTGQSVCLDGIPDDIPVPGLIGTIGWRHVDDANKCHETVEHQDVNDFQPATLAIKNIPGCDDAGDLEGDCDDLVTEIDGLLTTLDGLLETVLGLVTIETENS